MCYNNNGKNGEMGVFFFQCLFLLSFSWTQVHCEGHVNYYASFINVDVVPLSNVRACRWTFQIGRKTFSVSMASLSRVTSCCALFYILLWMFCLFGFFFSFLVAISGVYGHIYYILFFSPSLLPTHD